MSLQDPISDMLTQVRNAQKAGKTDVSFASSKQKVALADLLKQEGYISDYYVSGESKQLLTLVLRYYLGRPVIDMLRRISRPGLRVYKSASELPKVLGGLGVAVISTSRGLMTDRKARASGLGGEVLCYVA